MSDIVTRLRTYKDGGGLNAWDEAANLIEEQQEEITKLQGFINTQRENLGVQDAEITRLQGWEKELADMTIERDEARDAARRIYQKYILRGPDFDGLMGKYPWLEEE